MRIGRLGRKNPDTCQHQKTMAVTTSGIRRVICEACGHVSVSFSDELDSSVERDSFAREADTYTETETETDTGEPVAAKRGVTFSFMGSKA